VCVFSSATADVVIDLFASLGASGPLRSLAISPLPLSPDFSSDVNDYTIRCTAGTNIVTFWATAMPGALVTLSGATSQLVVANLTLTENQAVQVVAAAPGSNPIQYWVRCLPHDLPPISATRPGSPAPGWYLMANTFRASNGNYMMILDQHGTPVWYKHAATPIANFGLLPNGDLYWHSLSGPGFGTDPRAVFEIHQLDGTLVGTVAAVGQATDFHELLPLPNGDSDLLAYVLRPGVDLTKCFPGIAGFGTNETVVDGTIQEISPTGALVWQWNAADHIDCSETTFPQRFTVGGVSVVDLDHLNSIDVAPNGDLIVSARHLDAVFRINRATGQIVWKLGGTPSNHDNAAILSIHNDPGSGFFRQHDARLLGNGDLTVFDDRTEPAPPTPVIGPSVTGPARGVEYALDTAHQTATLVAQFVNPAGLPSFATGSTRRQPEGSTVIGWGAETGAPFPALTEVDANGRALYQVAFPAGDWGYRVIKVPQAALDINALRAGAGLP
jgi:hypothetical protein